MPPLRVAALCVWILQSWPLCLGSRPSRQVQDAANLDAERDVAAQQAYQKLAKAREEYIDANAQLDAQIDRYKATMVQLDEAEERLAEKDKASDAEAGSESEAASFAATIAALQEAGDPYREAREAYSKESQGIVDAIQDLHNSVQMHISKHK
mmetsp:Transcript_6751/g.11867  ORF Transcript_6751/g.11867 Transcript_6751/m.11867 type:complete len:153 (-) Transcript_6751:31-489(-)